MALQGSLSDVSLADLIQLIAASQKTGVFAVQNGSNQGQIFLEEGKIVFGSKGTLTGNEAVYDIAAWESGEFVFTAGVEPPDRTITDSNNQLLMEAARRQDEWRLLSQKIGSLEQVPMLSEPEDPSASVTFSHQEWAVVRRIDGSRSITEIARTWNQSPFEVCKVLYGLITSHHVALQSN